MEGLASLWGYQETFDELKQKLLYTTLELETVRAQANEDMRKNKDHVNQLLQHLKTACKERDEARDQIQKVLNKFIPFSPHNGIFKPAKKANSSLTESNSLSDTYNYQSPNDPFFDMVSSPDSSNFGGYIHNNPQPFVVDHESLVIETLVKGKTLPEKGKLLQAVLEAGPLLKTILVAGPLPRWRNPPPIQRLDQLPRVSIKGCDNSEIVKPSIDIGQVLKSSNLFLFAEMGCGTTSQMMTSGPLMHFNSGMHYDGVNTSSDYGSVGKRQRLQ